MTKGFFALLFILLAACGGAEDNNNHGYGWHYDASGDSGLRVRYDENSEGFSFAKLEQWYIEVQECAGIHAPGPLLVFVPRIINDIYLGYAYPSGLILIRSTMIKTASPEYVVRHEYIHHLLFQKFNYPDHGHKHPAFACAEPWFEG